MGSIERRTVGIMAFAKGHGIGTAPNRGLLRGTVIDLRQEPDGYGRTVLLKVTESQDVDELPNYTRSLAGKVSSFFLSDESLVLRAGDRIEAKATYRGGATGGRYSLLPDDIRKI
jgi:hypothetical protein